jgi:hypothetical protein
VVLEKDGKDQLDRLYGKRSVKKLRRRGISYKQQEGRITGLFAS